MIADIEGPLTCPSTGEAEKGLDEWDGKTCIILL